MNSKYTYKVDSHVDVGMQRSSNQDEIILLPEFHFFAVSDGMGGLINGGETSKMVKDELEVIMKEAFEELGAEPTADNAAKILKERIIKLNEQVYTYGKEYGNDRFGATLSGVWLVCDAAVFVNIGDSRGYIFADNALTQITKDHNLASHLVDRGELTKKEARDHPSKNRLLKYVGMKPPVTPDIFVERLIPGCRALLCSDGLHGMVEDEEIAKMLSGKSDRIAEKLVGAANANGGDDNVYVVHIAISEPE